MTMTIDISTEEEAWLQEEAARRGLAPADLLRTALRGMIGKDAGERPSWTDAAGLFPHSLLGEDAQEWVTRTRREDTERRDQMLSGNRLSAPSEPTP